MLKETIVDDENPDVFLGLLFLNLLFVALNLLVNTLMQFKNIWNICCKKKYVYTASDKIVLNFIENSDNILMILTKSF